MGKTHCWGPPGELVPLCTCENCSSTGNTCSITSARGSALLRGLQVSTAIKRTESCSAQQRSDCRWCECVWDGSQGWTLLHTPYNNNRHTGRDEHIQVRTILREVMEHRQKLLFRTLWLNRFGEGSQALQHAGHCTASVGHGCQWNTAQHARMRPRNVKQLLYYGVVQVITCAAALRTMGVSSRHNWTNATRRSVRSMSETFG